MSQEPVKVVVVLEGGMVQGVYTLGVPVHAVVIDYDCEGAHESEIEEVPQDDGEPVEAVVSSNLAERLGPALTEYVMGLEEG